MYRRVRSRHFVLLLTYGTYLVTPLVHTILEASQDGRATQIDEAVLSASCDGSCDNHTHHHHRGYHDAANCVICQSHAVSYLAVRALDLDLGTTYTAARVPARRDGSSSVDRHWPDTPRAPPALTVTT